MGYDSSNDSSGMLGKHLLSVLWIKQFIFFLLSLMPSYTDPSASSHRETQIAPLNTPKFHSISLFLMLLGHWLPDVRHPLGFWEQLLARVWSCGRILQGVVDDGVYSSVERVMGMKHSAFLWSALLAFSCGGLLWWDTKQHRKLDIVERVR